MWTATVLGLFLLGSRAQFTLPPGYSNPDLPPGLPQPAPPYMVDNVGNGHGVAPDKGSMNGPVLGPAQLDDLLKHQNQSTNATITSRQSGSFWLESISHGRMPFAPGGYQFFRNVKDFGAKGDGVTDDTAAINRAVVAMSSSDSTPARCGQTCASTTMLGAMVYFPPGTYMISTPIIQYYYTQFVGDATNRPTLKGVHNFTGIALIDTDVYIPGGNGAEWYINQSQFYRQIRNMIFDLTAMNKTNHDFGQEYVPTGIHWQVGQATSLQNLHFEMPVSDDTATTAVGVFMENGSGGFLSDLTFFGGNIGFRAGTQQYTARNLQFTSCLTAISQIWNWGMTWKNIYVYSCYIAIDYSHFNGVPYPITLRNGGPYPNIVLDNLLVENSASIVLISGGETIFPGSSGQTFFDSWAMGRRYTSLSGEQDPGDSKGFVTGFLSPQRTKPDALTDDAGKIFERSKPQYESFGAGGFAVATAHGIANDGSGDQSGAINSLLASSVGTPIFFPAGIYQVQNTVKVPVGSILVGEGWAQIMGTGSYFEDANNPNVMVQVGQSGDVGSIEISDMLFTVKGPTAGAILMEWNVKASSQGSAGMWDSHFRVGGAKGSNLQSGDCPSGGSSTSKCMSSFMLLHVTDSGNGYFENIWAWVADHDLDDDRNAYATEGLDGVPRNVLTQVSVYGARGVLIESQGPCWFHGTSSEHSIMYQYQLQGASNIYLGHMQTETPYFQASPDASQPYKLGQLDGDPTFSDCASGTNCEEAFALRIINSNDVFIYGAGFYSFFQNYDQSCVPQENCQEKLIQTDCTEGLWMYSIFTKGAEQVVSPAGLPPALQSDNQDGYTSEISAWLVLAEGGGGICGLGDSKNGSGVVYIDPTIFVEPSPTIGCFPPCTFVFPPSSVVTSAVITPKPVTTSIVIGGSTITTLNQGPVTVTVISFLTLSIPSGTTTSTFALTPVFQPPGIGVTVGTSTYTWPTLPTTVITVSGSTYTYSEDQITSLSTLLSQTTITTTFTDSPSSGSSSSSSSSTTVVPFIIWVNSGGFYWSPVPGPTPPPGPNPPPLPPRPPPLPSFPPIPNPPCFKFLDIFSIDCPPDKSKPTTHYTSEHPTPTCKTKCGTLPGNEQTSSECTTTTQTINGAVHVGCAPEPTDTSVPCDLSDETGFCPNGNFPVWDPETLSLNCDDNNDEAADDITACQDDADEDMDDIKDLIECETEPDACTPTKRSLVSRGSCKRKRKPYYIDDPNPAEQALGCDTTFLCDTGKWPNVCLNAKSAQDLRGKPSHLTYYGERDKYGHDITADWYNTHPSLGIGKVTENNKIAMEAGTATFGSGSRKQNQPWGGWGLYGCEVEEYPWGNSLQPNSAPNPITWAGRSVLRLIPQKENSGHGAVLKALATYGQKNYGPNFVYCVRVTGSTPADYGLDAAQASNECGRAYGVPFILVNDIKDSEARALPNERRWDPWFDSQNQLFEHTIISQAPPAGQAGAPYIKTTVIPSQYGTAPAPGHKTYDLVNSAWTTAASNGQLIGRAVPRDPPNADGSNLKWDTPGSVHTNPAGQQVLKKRVVFKNEVGLRVKEALIQERASFDVVDSGHNTTNVTSELDMDQLLPRELRRGLSARQLSGGSFLDPRVYTDILGCGAPDEDYCFTNLCYDGGVNFGVGDGQLKPGSPTSPYASGGNGAAITTAPTPTCVIGEDPDQGLTTAFCECDGASSRLPTLTGSSPCAYTALPTPTPTTRPPLGCRPGADPDSGATTMYCNCPGTTLPTLTSTSDICGYTAIPFICENAADPDNGIGPYCECSGYPGTLPTLEPTFTPYDACAYTTVPDPWPFQVTDGAGDIIACQSSSLSQVAGFEITLCAGSTSTVYTAPPPPTAAPTAPAQYQFGIFDEIDSYTDDVDGHVHVIIDGYSVWAASLKDRCKSSGDYLAEDKDGYGALTYGSYMNFKDGICGVGSNGGIVCESGDNSKTWTCKNQGGNGNVVATCNAYSGTDQLGCSKPGGDDKQTFLKVTCTGDINCDA
ncbi:hypothetical protein JX266_006898 [Neoarthrinium moseri]|nr:hypothetical protein JX266_006898 [Neoarthrinium moseri]